MKFTYLYCTPLKTSFDGTCCLPSKNNLLRHVPFLDEGYEYVLELFNLKTDPYEKVNLAASPAHSSQLTQLQDWARQLALQMVRTQVYYLKITIICSHRVHYTRNAKEKRGRKRKIAPLKIAN
jgi:hypothetical protein